MDDFSGRSEGRGAPLDEAVRRIVGGAARALAAFFKGLAMAGAGCLVCAFLLVLALTGFFGAAIWMFDPGGALSGPGGLRITTIERIVMGSICGALSVGALLGFRNTRRAFFPRSGESNRARRGARAAGFHVPRPDDPMWDRDLDG